MRTDTWVEHCPATARAYDPKITRTGIVTSSQHQGDYSKSKEEKDHLFLFFAFVIICFAFFLAEITCFVNPLGER
jgi:hypothetical protein